MSQNKNFSSLKRKGFGSAGIVLGALLLTVAVAPALIPTPGLAQPAASPPGGNVDAQFDTVTVGPSLFDFFIQPGGGSNTAITTGGNLIFDLDAGFGTLFFEEDGGATTMAYNAYGIWNDTGGEVLIDDSLFVDGNAQISTGLGDQSFVVDDPSGAYMEIGENGIYVTGPSTPGPYGQTGIYVSGGAGNAIYAVGNGPTVMQVQGTPSGSIASFYETNTGASVNLASANGQAINADGRTVLDGYSDASGSGGTGALEIDGSLRLDGNEIITDTSTPLYLQHGNNGDFYVDAGTLFVDSSANVVDVSGVLRANSIGGYLQYQYGNSCSGVGCSRYVTYSCPAGTELVNCGADSNTYLSRITDVYAWDDTCTVSGVSETSGTFTLYARLRCWDPDGY